MANDLSKVRKPCTKCLLSEISPDVVYREIKEYIDSLDAEEKVPDEVYEERLNACRQCESMKDGICALCGCFVEVRAVKRKNKCPALPAEWDRI